MSEIVITEFMDGDAVESLRQDHAVRYDPTLVEDRPRLEVLLADARALIVRNRTLLDRSLLAVAPDLRVVGRLGVGLDNIDVGACEDRSVAVVPATGANTVSVAEYVVGALLTLRRAGVFGATHRLLAGEWPRQDLVGREIAGMRLGLIGMGGIARAVATRVRALGVEVASHDPFVAADDAAWQEVRRTGDLPDLLRTSDGVSIHVPLTPDTHHLVDTAAIALLPRDAVIVNTARGGIVDEAAVCAALTDGRLGGAALDVFEREPLDQAAISRFAGVPNLLLTPHVAGVTEESNVAVSAYVAGRVKEVLGATGPVEEPL